MKILIAGGCGFLGSNIAADRLKRGDEVFIIDALFRVGAESNKAWLEDGSSQGKLVISVFDIAENDKLEQFFKENGPFDAIAHLAGQVAMTTSMSDPRRDFLTNVVGTFNVLEATRLYSPEAIFVYSSTNKVYGELNSLRYEETTTRYVTPDYPNGFAEDLPLDFSSPYGCSKGSADQYVRDWHRNFGLNTIVFRHSSIYGGRQFSSFDQGWVGWFCLQALKQRQALDSGKEVETFTIAGNGKQVRDVLYAQDLINLYNSAFECGKYCAGRIFNIGGGIENTLSLLELFNLLEEILDIQLNYRQLPPRHSDQKLFVADIQLAQEQLLWIPSVSASEGIRRQLEWVSKNL
ncbi:GDP-mannose 4,6-dehydratase [Synechocystis sp. CACIAM 05]|uniref:GDP-mannose 4,6-dehydratase n=1 Tax=Synechocystis sp. CACIAM 05 TaxID=1933929 RepID=UPI00138E764F|nr:GDP-mannose 4,6-dehydratase [Synechocystis sp. CACIAM 05]QHU98991.1 CDP-paratose 2-epimerase [Synechocystis sp. CACIAM 05]